MENNTKSSINEPKSTVEFSGFKGFAQQGWQCPICKRVYSPFTSMCLYCNAQESKVEITY